MFGLPAKFIGIALAVLAVLAGLWSYGHHQYVAGRADERAVWTVQLIAAQKALAIANAKTATLEAAQQAATTAAEARYADQIQTLNQRAVAADDRFRALGMRLNAARAACSQQLPQVAGSEPRQADTAESERRASEAGSRIGATGRDCADDAARVEFWNQWYTEQSALRR